MKFLKKTRGLILLHALVLLTALSASLEAGRANAADWAMNYGTAGANAYAKATEVGASGNVYIAGDFTGATFAMGGVALCDCSACNGGGGPRDLSLRGAFFSAVAIPLFH